MPNAFDGLGSSEPYVPDYLQDEIQFRIDNDLRTIAIPADGVVLGVVGDKNVNHVNFQMPAWYNGFNMSLFEARINFIDASGNVNYYTVTDMTVLTPEGNEVVGVPSDDDIIYFTWLVDSYATGYVGSVRFNVRLTKHDTSVTPAVLTQAFNTQVNSCQVLEGIQLADEITQEQAEDLLFHMTTELQDVTDDLKLDIEKAAADAMADIPEDYSVMIENNNRLNKNIAANAFDGDFEIITDVSNITVYENKYIDSSGTQHSDASYKLYEYTVPTGAYSILTDVHIDHLWTSKCLFVGSNNTIISAFENLTEAIKEFRLPPGTAKVYISNNVDYVPNLQLYTKVRKSIGKTEYESMRSAWVNINKPIIAKEFYVSNACVIDSQNHYAGNISFHRTSTTDGVAAMISSAYIDKCEVKQGYCNVALTYNNAVTDLTLQVREYSTGTIVYTKTLNHNGFDICRFNVSTLTKDGFYIDILTGQSGNVVITNLSIFPDKAPNNVITIAASDSLEDAKATADYVMDGVHDAAYINHIININYGKSIHLYFRNGTYYINDLRAYEGTQCGIVLTSHLNYYLEGENHSWFDSDNNADGYLSGIGGGVRFVISEDCIDETPSNTIISVIKHARRNNTFPYSHVSIKNISVMIPKNTHKIAGFDLMSASGIYLENCFAVVDLPEARLPVPAADTVGFLCPNGSQNSYYHLQNCYAIGFDSGFQVGGEHLMLISCCCVCCNYSYWLAISGGVYHANTLINCNEEHCIRSIYIDDGASDGVYYEIISHDIEVTMNGTWKKIQGAVEAEPGHARGRVSYCVTKAYIGSDTWAFWDEGSGVQFETRESFAKLRGSTTERPTNPSYNQQYYDTTINKVIFYTGSEWIDFNGNEV